MEELLNSNLEFCALNEKDNSDNYLIKNVDKNTLTHQNETIANITNNSDDNNLKATSFVVENYDNATDNNSNFTNRNEIRIEDNFDNVDFSANNIATKKNKLDNNSEDNTFFKKKIKK
jgi:hypothetical protein